MADSLHAVRFPNESPAYRAARDELLQEEIELRAQQARVAALRRELPEGGLVPEDYAFTERIDGAARSARLSSLFAPGKDSLALYSFMLRPELELYCPMCASFLDGADRAAPHVSQRMNLAVVARAPLDALTEFAARRGWEHLRLLSSLETTYDADYAGENADGQPMPTCTVFVRRPDGVHHFYSTELLFTPLDGQPRHVDALWPIWSWFDLTPEGRGEGWYPQLAYGERPAEPGH